jgi:poly-gamma-glutamate synthesis protein (capsule biosynthesis protein)
MHVAHVLRLGALLCGLMLAAAAAACDAGDSEPTPTPPPTGTPAPSPTPVPVTTLVFTGDIIPARCSYAAMQARGDYTAAFAPLRDTLAGADITVGTLDSTISNAAVPIGCTPTFNLAGPAAFIDALTFAGFDVISHAANHIRDCGNANCGNAAMLETGEILRAAGIAMTGSGTDLAAARVPAVVERNGVRFAFLAYDDIASYYHAAPGVPGSAPLDPATVAGDVAAARAAADLVVVLPHWGIEYTTDPSPRQREFARAAAAAGADLVVGNHPHWVQAHEQIGATFVAYALGNFVFDQDWSLETQQGAMLTVTFTGTEVTGTAYTPIRIYDAFQPRLAPPDEAASILARIEAASAALR